MLLSWKHIRPKKTIYDFDKKEERVVINHKKRSSTSCVLSQLGELPSNRYPGTVLSQATIVCSRLDNYSKNEGRKKSLALLLKNVPELIAYDDRKLIWATYFKHTNQPIPEILWETVLTRIIPKASWDDACKYMHNVLFTERKYQEFVQRLSK